MRRKFVFSVDEFYHVYSRGVDKRIIFSDRGDYRRFQLLLYLCNSRHPVNVVDLLEQTKNPWDRDCGETVVDIGSYCLMPNHFHLLLHEKAEGGISIFMKKLLTGYSMYFNKKNDRSGGLFEGTFRARHVDKDGYLEYLYSYIHLNPIKLIEPDWKEKGLSDQSKTLKYLENYLYSSYIDYLGADRIEGKIIGRTNFPEYFVSESDFVEEIENCLAYHEEQKEKDGPLFL